jgi:hypothetical protein
MSLDAHLRQTCVIVRDTPGGEDAYGGPGPVTTTTVYTGMCRYVEKSERIFSTDRSQVTIVTRYLLLLPESARDVEELDRVESVTMDGVAIAGPHRVTAVMMRRSNALHHMSVELERI